jgi:hypothetical protein
VYWIELIFLHDLVGKAVKSDEQLEKYIHEHDESERTIQLPYLKRQRKMCHMLLSKPFTTHPVVNAFDGVNFGSWEKGTLVAWVDDFMHSRKAGIFEYLGVLMLHPFTEKSSDNVENHIQQVIGSIQSSA